MNSWGRDASVREGGGGGRDGGRETKRASRGWKGGREKEDREDGGRPRINRSLPCSLPPLGRFPPPRPCSWPFPFVCPFTYQSTCTPATLLHLTPLHLARPPHPADTPFSRCNSQPSIVVLAPTYTRRYAGPDLSTRHTVSLSLSSSLSSSRPPSLFPSLNLYLSLFRSLASFFHLFLPSFLPTLFLPTVTSLLPLFLFLSFSFSLLYFSGWSLDETRSRSFALVSSTSPRPPPPRFTLLSFRGCPPPTATLFFPPTLEG